MFEEEELDIQCRLCEKTFSNDIAIRNHVRVEHDDAEVDVEEWIDDAVEQIEYKTKFRRKRRIDPEMAQALEVKKEQLVSKMEPQNLIAALAPENVQYVMFNLNSEDLKNEMLPKRRKKQASRSPKDMKLRKQEAMVEVKTPYGIVKLERGEVGKRKKVQQPLGPFTCRAVAAGGAGGECGAVYDACCDYSRHCAEVHAPRRACVLCQVCEEPLNTTTKFPCPTCSEQFDTREALTAHRTTHPGSAHACPHCSKVFTHRGSLVHHVRTHSGERPFKCGQCPAAFTQRAGLRLHEYRHSDARPYPCVVCGRAFRQPTGRRQHMRTHTHRAPYRCDVCGADFKQGSHLKSHQVRHHGMISDKTKEEKTEAEAETAIQEVEIDGEFYECETILT